MAGGGGRGTPLNQSQGTEDDTEYVKRLMPFNKAKKNVTSITLHTSYMYYSWRGFRFNMYPDK